MEFKIIEEGIGYGPDYGRREQDGDHIIYSVSGVTGANIFFLHRFENCGKKYSAIYEGHKELIKVPASYEHRMLEEFVKDRDRYLNNSW